MHKDEFFVFKNAFFVLTKYDRIGLVRKDKFVCKKTDK